MSKRNTIFTLSYNEQIVVTMEEAKILASIIDDATLVEQRYRNGTEWLIDTGKTTSANLSFVKSEEITMAEFDAMENKEDY